MRFHLDARVDHWRARGLGDDEARRRARVEFGTPDKFKTEVRRSIGLQWLDELRADAGLGIRRLLRTPTFTLIALTVLSLTIGATAAVFSVLETVMLEPLPVRNPEALRELAWVQSRDAKWQMTYTGSRRPFAGGGLISTSFSYPVFESLRQRATSFSDVFAFGTAEVKVGIGNHHERITAQLASGNFLTGLGVTPILGRLLSMTDDEPGAAPAVVIGHALWQRSFGGRADVLGDALSVNGRLATIVGVTGETFLGVDPGSRVDAFLPYSTFLGAVETDRRSDPRYWAFRVMARVREDATGERAEKEADAILRQALPPEFASDLSGFGGVVVRPGGQGSDSLRRNYSTQLYLLLAIMSSSLLVACGNIAGLMLVRTSTRSREMGVRLALGAARARLVRQMLTESGVLAISGSALGAVIALALRGSILPFLSREDGGLSVPLGIDGPLILFLIAVCVIVTLLSGALPAWNISAAHAALTSARNETGGGTTGPRLLAGKTLIAAQVALSMLLLAGAGLFVKTLSNLRAEPLGFEPDHVLLARLDATDSGYADVSLKDLYQRLLERIARLPGAEAASMSRYGLIGGGATTDTVVIPGAAMGSNEIRVHVHYVSGRHFDTLGIPLLAGRDFLERDREGAPRVAIVNDALAKKLPGGGLPLGLTVLYEDPKSPIEIVGMAADARFASVREPAPPTIYLPYRQYRQHQMTFSVRAAGDPAMLAMPVRRAIEEVDPKLSLGFIRTQNDQIDEALGQERTFAFVASAFALLAVTLASLGLYGTLSYWVSGRTPEIGLRMALGADRSGIALMVLRESLLPTVVGLGIGLVATVMTSQTLESMLFGLTPHDPKTIAAAAFVLFACAVVASWIPSRRASRVDPMLALRN